MNLRALSLRQPWASAVAHGGKRLENRGPGGWKHLERGIVGLGELAGEVIGIHASVSSPTSADLMGVMTAIRGPVPKEWEVGGSIVAVARIVDVLRAVNAHEKGLAVRPLYQLRAEDRDRYLNGARDPDDHGERLKQIQRWWLGPYALVLDFVVALPEPVPHRGALGFWQVESAKAKAIDEQLARAA